MTQKAEKAPHRVATGGDLRNLVLANCSDNNRTIADLQAQHLAVIFGLPADTAVVVAELVFGGAR
jgi:hypothetical protein